MDTISELADLKPATLDVDMKTLSAWKMKTTGSSASVRNTMILKCLAGSWKIP